MVPSLRTYNAYSSDGMRLESISFSHGYTGLPERYSMWSGVQAATVKTQKVETAKHKTASQGWQVFVLQSCTKPSQKLCKKTCSAHFLTNKIIKVSQRLVIYIVQCAIESIYWISSHKIFEKPTLSYQGYESNPAFRTGFVLGDPKTCAKSRNLCHLPTLLPAFRNREALKMATWMVVELNKFSYHARLQFSQPHDFDVLAISTFAVWTHLPLNTYGTQMKG